MGISEFLPQGDTLMRSKFLFSLNPVTLSFCCCLGFFAFWDFIPVWKKLLSFLCPLYAMYNAVVIAVLWRSKFIVHLWWSSINIGYGAIYIFKKKGFVKQSLDKGMVCFECIRFYQCMTIHSIWTRPFILCRFSACLAKLGAKLKSKQPYLVKQFHFTWNTEAKL